MKRDLEKATVHKPATEVVESMKNHICFGKSYGLFILWIIIGVTLCTAPHLWAGQEPNVEYKPNMELGQSQDLHIINELHGRTYTYELVSGGGTLNGSTYYADETISDCGDTPIIRVTDSNGMETELGIGVFANNLSSEYQMTNAFGTQMPGCDSGGCYWKFITTFCNGNYIMSNGGSGCCGDDCSDHCSNLAADIGQTYPIVHRTENCCPNLEYADQGTPIDGSTGTIELETDDYASPADDSTDLENTTEEPSGNGCPDRDRQGITGNPISILDGSKQERHEDMRFPGPGADLTLTRFYNSRYNGESALGNGWNHNFGASLQILSNGSIKIKDVDGHGYYFKETSSSEYIGLLNETTTLSLDDTDYSWHRDSGSEYRFDLDGRLIQITDTLGNQKALTYDAQDRLEAVTDLSSGRSLTFVYDGNDRIHQVIGPATEAVPDGIWVEYLYDDSNGTLTDVIYPDGSGFVYVYGDGALAHHLAEKQDRTGRILASWTYDNKGRAITNTTIDGQNLTIGYGEELLDNVVWVTDADDITKKYTLTRNQKRVLKVENLKGYSGCSDCGNSVKRYSYDENYNIIQKVFANGRIDQYFDYDSRGNARRVIQAVDSPEERTIYKTYHPDLGALLSQTESSVLGLGDQETIWDYDDDGNAIANENPTRLIHRMIKRGYTLDAGNNIVPFEYITAYEYNDRNQVTAIDGPLPGDQDKVLLAYDPVTGDLMTNTLPLVGTASYGYDAAGNLTSITDVNGVVTTITYDGRNRLLTTTSNGIIVSSLAYTPEGLLDTTTDAVGRILDYDYTAEGFLEKITDPNGNFMLNTYNTQGRLIEATTNTAGAVETLYTGYDYGDPLNTPDLSPGKPWKRYHRNHADTADLETLYAYDVAGRLVTLLDAQNNLTAYSYDLFNRLTQVEQPGPATTQYAYNTNGDLTMVIDAEGHETHYTYDDLGQLVETISPDTGTTRYVYDEAGRMMAKIHNAKTTNYACDALGRLTDVLYADSNENVSYTYDSGSGSYLVGRLAAMTDGTGSFSYSYNAHGQLTSQARTVDGVTYTTSYTYDDAGNLRTITYPTGQTIIYQADMTDSALIAAVRVDISGTDHTLASNLVYQPFGPLNGLTFGNNTALTKTYDKNNQVDTLTAPGIISRDYTPDDAGNITAIDDLLDTARSQSFTYDAQYRLTHAAGLYGDISFTYDQVGNRLTRTDTTGTDTYTYLNGTNKLRSISGPNAKSYSYDQNGNVIAALGGQQPPLTDQADYIHNANGQRTKKTVDTSQAVISHFDIAGRLIAETDTAGTMLKAYVWLNGQPLAMITANGSVYYYHNDHLGTPQKMTDMTANVVWAADYLPFGKADVTIATIENNLRFPGQYFDAETGLHNNWHRYYDPKLGRYLRADPIGLAGGINPYVYVQNNPVNFIDPYGLIEAAVPGPGLPLIIPPKTAAQKEADRQLGVFFHDVWMEYVHPPLIAAGDLLYGGGIGEWIYDITHDGAAPCNEARKGGNIGKGERGYTGPGDRSANPDKKKKYNPKTGKWEKKDPHTGKWKPTTPPK